jgi:hypothetical protein
VSAAAEQLGTEVARNGPCHAGLLGVDTAEAIERADIGERVCEEVSIIRREGAVRALDRATTALDYANPERRTGHDQDAQDAHHSRQWPRVWGGRPAAGSLMR